MRKKDANPYRATKPIEPPFLTKQQISDFYEQFTLLGSEISVKRISQTVGTLNWSKFDKVINKFFEELKRNMLDDGKKVDCQISFEDYFEKMIQFFIENNENNQMMVEMLADSETGEISKQTIKQALQDSLGRKIYAPQLGVIMDELKKDNFLNDKLKRTKIEEESEI